MEPKTEKNQKQKKQKIKKNQKQKRAETKWNQKQKNFKNQKQQYKNLNFSPKKNFFFEEGEKRRSKTNVSSSNFAPSFRKKMFYKRNI